jgi:hypothetical protein
MGIKDVDALVFSKIKYKMGKETIKSWKGSIVRIKSEYLRIEKDNVICTANSGLSSILDDITAEFKVVSDVYGVDLYYVREDTELQDLREPQHLIILKEGYSFVWDAKWFEVVKWY